MLATRSHGEETRPSAVKAQPSVRGEASPTLESEFPLRQIGIRTFALAAIGSFNQLHPHLPPSARSAALRASTDRGEVGGAKRRRVGASSDYARERGLAGRLADPGSIPGASSFVADNRTYAESGYDLVSCRRVEVRSFLRRCDALLAARAPSLF